ncbi:MAG: isochorismatase family protein [Propioniciclava sp.]|uniref:isochorismatase family protein n=1 Tax=Propioniciclava sp. TaxID=2038686 RepID=UPI0039E51DBB
MPLPALIDYATPTQTPANRLDWTLDPARAAVLVHDLQQYFVRPFAPGCPALTRAVESTAAILQAARAAGVPVFYTAQHGDQDPVERGLQREAWGPGMTSAPEDTAILPAIAPRDGEVVLDKRRYSAFAKSDFGDRLAALGRDQLVIVGVYAHIGVLATAYDAFQREVAPFVVADGIADFGLADHERALAQVADCCGVVTVAAEVVDALASRTPAPEASGTASDAGDASDAGAENQAGGGWDDELRGSLEGLLAEDAVAAAFAAPETDLFSLGLDSMRAFEMLDRLLDAGADIDFGEFTRRPNIAFLREQGTVSARS